ncbi:hypothetical protein QBZ16_001900 [Prototheca wickerhamii]|uniref:2-hydroxy-3-oxopropionate reductase n=1 Tax=Prototheca wickerhamii TaxID=3111 RepID=A0AAD9IJD8_PROWI|nr:hypothetical protein QBZ16_001900 [Prototheca wickerhamii]
MATRLMRAGYDVLVWNRSPDACDELAAGGAEVLSSPAEVTDAADITLAMLADPQACAEVALGRDGAVKGLRAGKGYIDSSTVDVTTMQRVEHAVRGQGAAFLEAPVSGSKAPAEQGKLIFMAAGDLGLYQSAVPLFQAMGKMHVYLGEVGSATKMKLVVNMIMGSMMVAFAEGLALSQAAGLNAEDLLRVVNESAIASPMLALKGPQMIRKTFDPAFPLKHQQKDMRLALKMGATDGQYLPVAAAANEAYLRAKLHGQGDLDFSAVIKALHPGDLP